MQKTMHRDSERGGGEYDWLNTRYSFSFANWYNPERMGFGALRVINDDRIAPSSGFGAHSHQNMEIITIVTSGTVTHKDSIGNTGTVPAGDVQVMSAGSGVTHSEYNDSSDEELALFQIWIESKSKGIAPRYAQKSFRDAGATALLVSPDGRDGSLSIHQNAFITRMHLSAGERTLYELRDSENGAYLFVTKGTVSAADEVLSARDALGVSETPSVPLSAEASAELIVIEVPVKIG